MFFLFFNNKKMSKNNFIIFNNNVYHFSRFDILNSFINYYLSYLYDAVYNNDIKYINNFKSNINNLIFILNNKIKFFNENPISNFKFENLKYKLNLFFKTFNFIYLTNN